MRQLFHAHANNWKVNNSDSLNRDIWKAAPSEAISELNTLARFRKYKRGQVIINQDERNAIVGFVVAGTVKIFKQFRDGREQIVKFLLPPDFLGRLFLARSRFSYEAVDRVTLCVFDRHRFEGLLSRHPEIHRILLEMVLGELDTLYEKCADFNCRTAMQRQAKFLHEISQHMPNQVMNDENASRRVVTVPICRADLADYLNIAPETISRNMHILDHNNIIRLTSPNTFEVIDEAMLLNYARLQSDKPRSW